MRGAVARSTRRTAKACPHDHANRNISIKWPCAEPRRRGPASGGGIRPQGLMAAGLPPLGTTAAPKRGEHFLTRTGLPGPSYYGAGCPSAGSAAALFLQQAGAPLHTISTSEREVQLDHFVLIGTCRRPWFWLYCACRALFWLSSLCPALTFVLTPLPLSFVSQTNSSTVLSRFLGEGQPLNRISC